LCRCPHPSAGHTIKRNIKGVEEKKKKKKKKKNDKVAGFKMVIFQSFELLTGRVTPWSKVILQKLTVAQLVKNLPPFI
jgi:hypothetical protein